MKVPSAVRKIRSMWLFIILAAADRLQMPAAGMMIFGPIGILCGLCGASPGFTDDYWVCHSCGKKFQAGTAKAAEKAWQEKIQQELNAKARRKHCCRQRIQ